MDVEKVLCMKEGLGDTSYALNSCLQLKNWQKKGMEAMKHVIVDAGVATYGRLISSSSGRPERMAMADLGCASEPNALSMLNDIVAAINTNAERRREEAPPEFMVFLNDLPSNDFNATFASFPAEYFTTKKINHNMHDDQVFLAGVPGSFFARLFPRDSLHFIYSCYSLHWLSQVPPGLVDEQGRHLNGGKIYISERSPQAVVEAYAKQFRRDFISFLKLRSVELMHGGRMVLLMIGRKTTPSPHHHQVDDDSTTFFWECLADSFAILVALGEVSEEKVNAFDAPFYAPCTKEIEEGVKKEGSFQIEHLEFAELSTSCCGDGTDHEDVKKATMTIRAIQEPMIRHHFGGDILDPLFTTFANMLLARIRAKQELGKAVHLIVVLEKN